MDPIRIEEYSALRATIRERGTWRVALTLATFAVWGTLTVAIVLVTPLALLSIVPLVVLVAGFEGGLLLHLGIERIGRYVQVAFEEQRDRPGWEMTAVSFGERFPEAGLDALFFRPYLLATAVNFLLGFAGDPVREDVAVLVLVHAAFVIRLVLARRSVAAQRAHDLERFRGMVAELSLRRGPGEPPAREGGA